MDISNLLCGGRRARRDAGVTMIELLIVVLIGAVLAVIAAPSLQSVLRSTRQNSAMGELLSDLNFARGEAIKRNSRVLLCARDSAGTNCETSSPDWTRGWVVCIEGAAAQQCAASTEARPNPILVHPPLDASLSLSATNPSSASVFVIRFSADSSQTTETVEGTRDGAIAIQMLGNWDGAVARTLQVAASGNVSRQ